MMNKKSIKVLPKEKVLSAIFESVEQFRSSKDKDINPLENARKLLQKDLDYESAISASVYKSVSRTFNDLLNKGYLKIEFGEEFNEKDPLYYHERRREVLNGKDPFSFTSYILEKNSIEIYNFIKKEQLYSKLLTDLEEEVDSVLSVKDLYIAVYYGRTLREMCDLWSPPGEIKKKAKSNIRDNAYAPFISTIGDIFLPLMSMKDFQEIYNNNSNEISTLLNSKLYQGFKKGDKEIKFLLMNFPALISLGSLEELINQNNLDILSLWKESIIKSEVFRKHTELFENTNLKVRTFLLSLGSDPKKEDSDSSFKKMYCSMSINKNIDFSNCYAEILGRYFSSKNGGYCIGGTPDPKSMPPDINNDNFFKAMYYLNTGMTIENLKTISKRYYIRKQIGDTDKGMGVTVILADNSYDKLKSLGYFISRKADEKHAPYFNRVYMLKEHMSDLEDIIYELTKDRNEDYYTWRENKEKEIGKGKK